MSNLEEAALFEPGLSRSAAGFRIPGTAGDPNPAMGDAAGIDFVSGVTGGREASPEFFGDCDRLVANDGRDGFVVPFDFVLGRSNG